MKKPARPTRCYIAAQQIGRIDSYLDEQGFCSKLLAFAIPSLGVLFRCRTYGDPIELEFGAFFSLLRFIETRLKDTNIKDIVVYSSNSEFVFAFAGHGSHILPGSARDKLIREHSRKLNIAVEYIVPQKNWTIISAADFPSMPLNRQSSLKPSHDEQNKIEIKPIQKGLRL